MSNNYGRWDATKHDKKAGPIVESMTPEQRVIYYECRELLYNLTEEWKAERKRANELAKLFGLWNGQPVRDGYGRAIP